eukprot:TRINITY_DN930_c0_g1_i1.p1 TRINITY_DN930_c0_g1~~TRINITY_DN930_c0_g1_i1.p1  ORF type:complete len:322 (+),score=82.98 TRINITY_DN930_c0_g1_i1:132-1097(+)
MGNNNTRAPAPKTVVFTPGDALRVSSLEFSKQLLDFNTKENGCPLNTAVTDEVELTNNGRRKLKFKFEPVHPTSCKLSFSPSSGAVDPGKSKKIVAKLILLTKVNLNFKITVRVQGGESLFINLRVTGESGVFGVDPMTLEQVDDGGYRVPQVLVNMKEFVISKGGLTTEGVFRLAGDQTEIRRIKESMNKKSYDFVTNDVNAITSLLKIWFRELPVPILNTLPQDAIMNFSSAGDCVEAYHCLPEPQKTLLSWLLDFLSGVASNAAVNKMTSQNLAIVIAPNLYDISTPNPMEGLILSQKCAQFLNHVLNSRISTTSMSH